MYEGFVRGGEIDEVVIPSKRNIWRRLYGFVRFFDVKDTRLMTTKLDNIFIGNHKIFVNRLRFDKRQAHGV